MNFGQFDVVEPLAPLAAGVPGAAGSGVPWFPAAADVVPSEPVPAEPAVPDVPVASVVEAPGASAGSGVPELPAAADASDWAGVPGVCCADGAGPPAEVEASALPWVCEPEVPVAAGTSEPVA
ncbi:hypothetical protein C5U48_08885, partial [Mycolicibacter virginiensis]